MRRVSFVDQHFRCGAGRLKLARENVLFPELGQFRSEGSVGFVPTAFARGISALQDRQRVATFFKPPGTVGYQCVELRVITTTGMKRILMWRRVSGILPTACRWSGRGLNRSQENLMLRRFYTTGKYSRPSTLAA